MPEVTQWQSWDQTLDRLPGPSPFPDPPSWTCTVSQGPTGAQLRAQADEDAHRSPPEVTTCPPSLHPPPELRLGLVGERRFGRAGALTQSSASPCTLPSSSPQEGLGPAWERPVRAQHEGKGWKALGKCPGPAAARGGLPGGGKRKCWALGDKREVPVQAMPAVGGARLIPASRRS